MSAYVENPGSPARPAAPSAGVDRLLEQLEGQRTNLCRVLARHVGARSHQLALVEDCVAEAIVRVVAKARHDATWLRRFANAAKLAGYAYRVAMYEYFRLANTPVDPFAEVVLEVFAASSDEETSDDDLRTLDQKLGVFDAAILRARYEEQSYEEIAEQIGAPTGLRACDVFVRVRQLCASYPDLAALLPADDYRDAESHWCQWLTAGPNLDGCDAELVAARLSGVSYSELRQRPTFAGISGQALRVRYHRLRQRYA
jgi:DNA-directed RNA polymerase specialized sigma24 family protein